MSRLPSGLGLKAEHSRALRIVRERAASGEVSRADDIRWDDYPEETLRRHPYLRGRRDEKLAARRAPSVLKELLGAGLIVRTGGSDEDPAYSPVSGAGRG